MNMSLWKYSLDFGHGNQRQIADEQEEQRKEYSERTGKHAQIVNCRLEYMPARWQKIAGKRRYDYYESFEPHPYIYQQ